MVLLLDSTKHFLSGGNFSGTMLSRHEDLEHGVLAYAAPMWRQLGDLVAVISCQASGHRLRLKGGVKASVSVFHASREHLAGRGRWGLSMGSEQPASSG